MRRRLVAQGNNSNVVTLPIRWIRDSGLKPGDDIEVEERGKSLVLSVSGISHPNKATLMINAKEPFYKRYLRSLYMFGYDEIEVTSEKSLPLNLIEEEVKDLLGFEIVSHTDKSCVIKSVAREVDLEFDAILKRIFMILLTLFKETEEQFQRPDTDKLRELAKSEAINNRLTFFCQRVLNKKGYKENKKTNFISMIVNELEQMTDSFQELCVYLADNDVKVGIDTKQSFSSLSSLFSDFYSQFYSYDQKQIGAIKDKRMKLFDEMNLLFRSKKGDELVVIHHLISILDKIHHLDVSLDPVSL